jgi:carbamoyltransferase
MRVLGFTLAHDASVCVICDGKIEYFAKEERYTRIKRDKQPFLALERAIEAVGQIDAIVMQSPSYSPLSTDIFKVFTCKKAQVSLDNFLDMSMDHHLSHAYNAFNNSNFDKCLTIVVDRDGSDLYDPVEWNADDALKPTQTAQGPVLAVDWIGKEAESVFIMQQPSRAIEIHKSWWMRNPTDVRSPTQAGGGYYDFHQRMQSKYPSAEIHCKSGFSLTKVYESGTTLIGESPLENGKTMGLAAYGKSKGFPKLFDGFTPIDHYLTHEGWAVCPRTMKILPTTVEENNYEPYADWAFHIQRETERALHNIVKKYVDKTGIKKVCITGGYGLNVVANNYLIKMMPEVEFWFEPLADDTGNSIGAAWYVYRTNSGDSEKYPQTDTFYHHLEPQRPIEGSSSTPQELAQLLADGKSIALYDGLPEAGPRALGHRSILFDPRNPNAKDELNKIKKREWYRPFAGIILEEYFDKYFETLGLTSSPNMTVSFDAKEKALQEIPGVIHVDGTCRMQTVTDGYMADVLREYNKITGVPVLMNTSFNLAGEALVHTVDDALETLRDSTLDYVYFVQDDSLIGKNTPIEVLDSKTKMS